MKTFDPVDLFVAEQRKVESDRHLIHEEMFFLPLLTIFLYARLPLSGTFLAAMGTFLLQFPLLFGLLRFAQILLIDSQEAPVRCPLNHQNGVRL